MRENYAWIAPLDPARSIRRATVEPRWMQVLLTGGAILFLGVFLFVPLVAVFGEALRNGVGAYAAAIAQPEARSAIKLTLLTAAVVVPLIHRAGIRNISGDQLEVGASAVRFDIGAFKRRVIKIVEVINHRNARPLAQAEPCRRRLAHQVINEVAADESRAAGDQNIFHSRQIRRQEPTSSQRSTGASPSGLPTCARPPAAAALG